LTFGKQAVDVLAQFIGDAGEQLGLHLGTSRRKAKAPTLADDDFSVWARRATTAGLPPSRSACSCASVRVNEVS